MELIAVENLLKLSSTLDGLRFAQQLSGSELNCFAISNATLLTLSWKIPGDTSVDETSLLIIDDSYIYLPNDKIKWLYAWEPVLNLKDKKINLSLPLSSLEVHEHLIAGFPKYNGDFSFHFGHFHRDVIGLLVLLKNKYLSSPAKIFDHAFFDLKYILSGVSNFHLDLLDHLGIPSSMWTCRDFVSTVVYSDSSKSISAVKFNGLILKPDLDFAISYLLESCHSRDFILGRGHNFLSRTHNKANQVSVPPSSDVLLTGALLTRYSPLAANKRKRWSNDYEILSASHKFIVEGKQIQLEFKLVDHESLLPIARAKALSTFDFVIGSGSSAMYPSLIFSQVLHLIVLPRQPSHFELFNSALRDFRVFGLSNYSFLFLDFSGQTSAHNDDIWQSSYVIEIAAILHKIEAVLCSTCNPRILYKLRG